MFSRSAGISLAAVFCMMCLSQAVPAHEKHHQGKHQTTVTKYSGQVEAVEQEECSVCKCVELSVGLKVNGETLLVKLGPKQYFDERDFALSRGDMIEVSGIAYRQQGRTVVLATDVRKGSDTITLRGKFGKPGWLQEHGHTCPRCGN